MKESAEYEALRHRLQREPAKSILPAIAEHIRGEALEEAACLAESPPWLETDVAAAIRALSVRKSYDAG